MIILITSWYDLQMGYDSIFHILVNTLFTFEDTVIRCFYVSYESHINTNVKDDGYRILLSFYWSFMSATAIYGSLVNTMSQP
jgi:hypothetical protein